MELELLDPVHVAIVDVGLMHILRAVAWSRHVCGAMMEWRTAHDAQYNKQEVGVQSWLVLGGKNGQHET